MYLYFILSFWYLFTFTSFVNPFAFFCNIYMHYYTLFYIIEFLLQFEISLNIYLSNTIIVFIFYCFERFLYLIILVLKFNTIFWKNTLFSYIIIINYFSSTDAIFYKKIVNSISIAKNKKIIDLFYFR